MSVPMYQTSRVAEGRRGPAAGKRLAWPAHKLRHAVTKLAPEAAPLVREASGEAGRPVRIPEHGVRFTVQRRVHARATRKTKRTRVTTCHMGVPKAYSA